MGVISRVPSDIVLCVSAPGSLASWKGVETKRGGFILFAHLASELKKVRGRFREGGFVMAVPRPQGVEGKQTSRGARGSTTCTAYSGGEENVAH